MSERDVMVIQQGARRNYVYARQLESAGLLHSLVTDAAWTEGSGEHWKRLAARLSPRIAGALARRTVLGVTSERLRASFLPNFFSVSKSFLHEERAHALIDEALAWPNRLRGLDGARIVVNYQGNGGSFLSFAKRRGARIATDFVISPRHREIERAERKIWPGWEHDDSSEAALTFYRARVSRIIALSDLYLCPSEAVARDLAEFPGFDPGRLRILPYGASGVKQRRPNPTPGRILFAGAAGLRKGVPYLAEAARLLKQERRGNFQFIVAGPVTETVRRRPETRELTFLGHLDPACMADEFAKADIFCLPSLSEGSATSIYEAMTFGLPVVTTLSSGSVVRDGAEGYLVPERDAEALADRLLRIAVDRQLRRSMSETALATAERYSDENCGRAFVRTIRELATNEWRVGA